MKKDAIGKPNGFRALTLLLGVSLFSITAMAEEPTSEQARPKPWERLSLGSSPTSSAPEASVGASAVTSQSLKSTWEAVQGTEYEAFTGQIDSNGSRLSTLEGRVSALENVDIWYEMPATNGAGFEPSGAPYSYSNWSPALGSQTTDFDQSRTYNQEYEQTTRIFEEHAATGERRLKSQTTETKTVTDSESRRIDVAQTPSGGTDGWSPWENIGGIYSCTSWSPDRSSVTKNQYFTQSRQCNQDQESDIYYLSEGVTLYSQTRARTLRPTEYRGAYGTKITVECRDPSHGKFRAQGQAPNSGPFYLAWGSSSYFGQVASTGDRYEYNGYLYWPGGNWYNSIHEICRRPK